MPSIIAFFVLNQAFFLLFVFVFSAIFSCFFLQLSTSSVVRAKNPTLIGITGICIQETQETFKIVIQKNKDGTGGGVRCKCTII